MNVLKRIVSAIKKASPVSTMGVPGSVVIGGYEEDTEKDFRLAGREQYRTYSDLLANISIVAAGTRYFLNLVGRAVWKVTPADDSAEAVRIADIIRENYTNMETSWSRIVRRGAMYRFYGFSVQEWTAVKNDDGVMVFKDIAPRPQITIERWDVSKHGKVLNIIQRAPQDGEEIILPRKKTIYIVDDSLNDSPTGLGLFRHIVESCRRLQRYEQLEGFGFESDLRGIPIGRAPFAEMQELVDQGLMTDEQKASAEAPLKKFITNHIKNPALGILVDSITYQGQDEASTPSQVKQWDVDLLKGSSTSLQDMANAIERSNREIARTLGVEGLLLGEQTSGSHALSKDKSLNFALIVDSTLGELADTYKRDYIMRLFELNGWDKKLMPSFEPEAIQHRDITQVTAALKDLADAGATMDPEDLAIDEVRQALGLAKHIPFREETNDELAAKKDKRTIRDAKNAK